LPKYSKTPHDQQKAKGEQKKGKGGREPTIVIVVCQIMTIVEESSQKLNKIGKTSSSRCGVYLAISRKDKSIKQKTKAGESEEKDKTVSAMSKKTKVFSKSSPLLYTLLLEHAGSQAKSRHLPSGELELGQVGNTLSEKLSWLGQ
jgi:hypothetical protein